MQTQATTMPLGSMPVPMPTGSLEAYVQTVNRFPILSAEEERALAQRFRAEGNIGLMKAVKRFDPERGVRLVSFAIHWIKAEIHEYILRNWRMVKVATTKAQRKLFFNLRSMKTGLAPLTGDDIKRVAAELRVKPEEVVEMEKRLSGQEIAFEADDDDEDSYAPAQYLADHETEPYRVLEAEESARVQAASLQKALASLDPRSRRSFACSSVSTPSATTLRRSECASETIVETSVIALASSCIAVINERSILSDCTGSFAR